MKPAESCLTNLRVSFHRVQHNRWRGRAKFPTLGLSAAILFCGCHKEPEATNTPSQLPSASSSATNAREGFRPAAQPLPPSTQTIAASATAEEAAAQLTLELRRYVAYTRNIPKNFEEFAARDPIKFPPPPAGKKYVITGGMVKIQ
jgi:hypothetical protein